MKFRFWQKYFEAVSIIFCLMGCYWAISGTFEPFGTWDSLLANSFFDSNQLSEEANRVKSFILGPLGATSAGYFFMQYMIVKYAWKQQEMWSYNAILYAFLIWIILDSVVCLYHGAYFNIFLANLPCLIAMSPLFIIQKYFKG